MAQAGGLARISLDGVQMLMPEQEAASLARGEFERLTRELLMDALPVGGVMVDVGAHVGIVTLQAARHVGPKGHIHAVEPTAASVETLHANLELNGLENVSVHRCAAGRSEGYATLHQMDLSHLNSALGAHRQGSLTTAVEVPVRPLDELLSGRIDAMKIDVEGGELEVLAGAERVLAENPHLTLCVEWNPMWLRSAGHDPMELLDALSDRGFRPTLVADEARLRVAPVDEIWPSVAAGGAGDDWWANVLAYGSTGHRGAIRRRSR
jgi:FkbM family methyltransferase